MLKDAICLSYSRTLSWHAFSLALHSYASLVWRTSGSGFWIYLFLIFWIYVFIIFCDKGAIFLIIPNYVTLSPHPTLLGIKQSTLKLQGGWAGKGLRAEGEGVLKWAQVLLWSYAHHRKTSRVFTLNSKTPAFYPSLNLKSPKLP